jgi:hypothetical protein
MRKNSISGGNHVPAPVIELEFLGEDDVMMAGPPRLD